MWETTALHLPLSKVRKNVKVRGLPHLAKNERDMGHPTIPGREKEDPGVVEGLAVAFSITVSAMVSRRPVPPAFHTSPAI
jgi:hypothetical protein